MNEKIRNIQHLITIKQSFITYTSIHMHTHYIHICKYIIYQINRLAKFVCVFSLFGLGLSLVLQKCEVVKDEIVCLTESGEQCTQCEDKDSRIFHGTYMAYMSPLHHHHGCWLLLVHLSSVCQLLKKSNIQKNQNQTS